MFGLELVSVLENTHLPQCGPLDWENGCPNNYPDYPVHVGTLSGTKTPKNEVTENAYFLLRHGTTSRFSDQEKSRISLLFFLSKR